MWRKLFDVLFWISISTLFGGTLIVGAIVAPAVFDTSRDAKLAMPGIAVPPLEMGPQVGGEIFGAVLNRFAVLEGIMLTVMAVAIAGWVFSYRFVRRSTWVIAVMWVCLVALTLFDTFTVRSRVWDIRTKVRETAAAHLDYKDGMTSWPEKTTFDALHKRSEAIGHWKAYLMLAMLLTASWRGAAEKKSPGGFRRMRVLTPMQ